MSCDPPPRTITLNRVTDRSWGAVGGRGKEAQDPSQIEGRWAFCFLNPRYFPSWADPLPFLLIEVRQNENRILFGSQKTRGSAVDGMPTPAGSSDPLLIKGL